MAMIAKTADHVALLTCKAHTRRHQRLANFTEMIRRLLTAVRSIRAKRTRAGISVSRIEMIAKTAVYRILAKRTRADISVSLVAKESDIQQV